MLAEFIEKVEEAISNNQVATRQDLNLQELKLTREIKEVELKLTKEIKELEVKLTREIETLRGDVSIRHQSLKKVVYFNKKEYIQTRFKQLMMSFEN